jgi:hypothetical protein
MKNIRKISVLLFSALVATSIMMPINSAHASISNIAWVDPLYKGYDQYYYYPYYYYIVAYLNGTTATMRVAVMNNVDSDYINVTSVEVVFENGLNKTLDTTGSPVRVDYQKTQYPEVSFTADTNELPNEWPHTFIVYVKFVYSDGSSSYFSYSYSSYGYTFVVYLQDQKEFNDLRQKFWAYEESMDPDEFTTVKARLLATQAVAEANTGDDYYNIGSWAEGKTHYQTALDLYDQAFSIEEEKGVAMEDAYLNATVTEAGAAAKTADAATVQANAAMNQSYGYILLGLGIVLVGIGAIIYGIRKPKPVPT